MIRVLTIVKSRGRDEYLQAFLESFYLTAGAGVENSLLLLDDHSPGSLRRSLLLDGVCSRSGCSILVAPKRIYAPGLTNIGLRYFEDSDYDLAFFCDDDVTFIKQGWEKLYIEAVMESGYEHLSYYNEKVKQPSLFRRVLKRRKIDKTGRCEGKVAVTRSLGLLQTVSKSLIHDIGFVDSRLFPKRKYWHWDYSLRACRRGYNDKSYFFDAAESDKYIATHHGQRDYISVIEGEEKRYISSTYDDAHIRRIMHQSDRNYVSFPEELRPIYDEMLSG